MGVTYTSAGEELVVDLIDHTVSATGWYIAWGSSTVTDAKGDTALSAEATDVRATATSESQPTADKNQWIGTMTVETVAKTIKEAGLFTAATGGVCVIRASHADVVAATSDQIRYTITLEQT